MALFILRRLIQSLFVLLAVSVVVFFAVYAVGDPIELLVSRKKRLDLDGILWRAVLAATGQQLGAPVDPGLNHGLNPGAFISRGLVVKGAK